MDNFTPISGLIGGLMIGVSAAIFLLASGRISGISGILEGALRSPADEGWWRTLYLAGLPLGTLVVLLAEPHASSAPVIEGSWIVLAVAGLLVGYGARLGGGCTSGHGVCGIPRLSARSIVATGVFMGVAALVVFLTRHVAA